MTPAEMNTSAYVLAANNSEFGNENVEIRKRLTAHSVQIQRINLGTIASGFRGQGSGG